MNRRKRLRQFRVVIPHGCSSVPQKMGSGHTFAAPMLPASDRAKPSAGTWCYGVSARIIATAETGNGERDSPF